MEPTTPKDFRSASPAPIEDPDFDIASPLEPPDRMEPAGLRWILGSGLVALVGIGGWIGYQTFLQSPPEPLSVVMAPVNRQDLEVSITEAGVVELGGQQTFKAPSDVTVQAVLVEERERVSQGQVLIELRDRDLQQRLDNQRVQNQINQLDLQRQQEVLQERQVRLRDAENRLRDSADLLAQGYISEDEFRDDQRSLEDEQSDVRNAEVEVTKAELRVQQDNVNTANIQLQLEDNQIVAPIDAIVLKVDVKAGDGVEREGRLLSIGDPTKETIRLQMTTLNAAKVGVGMPVRVSVIGPNPEVFEGQIRRISPQAITNQNNSEQSTVEAEAALSQPSDALIPGSAVSVDIILQQRQDALVVPVAALQRDADGPYVWVQDAENRAQKRPVTVGLETLEAIEILSGLDAGDEVVVGLPPEAEMTPGSLLTTPEEGANRDGPGSSRGRGEN